MSAPADAVASSGAQLDASANAGERSSMQEHAERDAGASSSMQAGAQVAELRAKANGLETQLEQAQGMIKFLQEEVISARDQRGDVVKIAEQMLGTLQTIAVGGRLQRTTNSTSEPVRYQTHGSDVDSV